MRIGFLLNHDQVHQAAHVVPIAAAVRRLRPDVDLVVAATSDRLADEAARLAARLGTPVPILRLGLRRLGTRALARLLDGAAPASRIGIYGDRLDFFRALDALVVPEKTSLILKRRFGLGLPLIHTRHGAGDRAIGFNAESALFDHVLVAGAKIRDRLVAEAGVAPGRISVVGYPKFDLAPGHPELRFADPGRPVVLYAPHPSPHLSSWYRWGRAVLEHFRRSDRYNLVFAPHVMLFQRRFAVSLDRLAAARVGRVPAAVRAAPNIHVDLGSPASADMSYTDAADIYLGDASSQVYEYLRRPRPCLFLDAHGLAAGPDTAAWAAGEVLRDLNGAGGGLGPALARAGDHHPEYLATQRALFARTFDLTDEPSSDRAARAVMRVAEGRG